MSDEVTDEFTCPSCGSQSVCYPERTQMWRIVTCRACGTKLGTLAEFRRFVHCHTVLPASGVVSGC